MKPQSIVAFLSANPYPGRGIIFGKSPDGTKSIAVYFIMGRSENSRNRVFIPAADGIRTQAHDPSKMTDPSLIIYHPVREVDHYLIVTNGNQTDTIRDAVRSAMRSRSNIRQAFVQALDTRTFEPDAPNYTPRISGMLDPDGAFDLSILKTVDGDPDRRCHAIWHYDNPVPGEGRFLRTYQGDGDPLPSFEGEPVRVALDAPGAKILSESIWNALNEANKISLYVRYTDINSGEHSVVLLNKRASNFRGHPGY